MNFSLSEEQLMMQDSIIKFIRKDYSFEKRIQVINEKKGYSEEFWQLFAELGWLMIPFSEEDGGLGGSNTDLMVVMEELGKGLVVEPFIATAILSGSLIASCAKEPLKSTLLAEIMEGKLQLAFAYAEPQSRFNLSDIKTTATPTDDGYIINGRKSVVLNGGEADKLIVAVRTSGSQFDREGISLLLVDAENEKIIRRDYQTVDGFRAAEIEFDNVFTSSKSLIGEISEAYQHIEFAINKAILSVCAEAVGAMEVIFNKTVEYTKIRNQFGTNIGKFQALQHRMADMFIEHQQAKSILLMAAMDMDKSDCSASKAVSAAKSRIGKAARQIGQEAVQIHGGIGVTDELDVGHFFKRLTTIELLFGNTDFHTRRFASLE